MLTRFNIVIAGLLVVCALGLVTSQHRARKLFIDLERAQAHAAAHEVRWNQLQVEQTELAKSALIDARARRELGMQAVPAERTLHLSVDPVTRSVSLSQPWREKPVAGSASGVRAAAARATGPARPDATAPRSGPDALRVPAAGSAAAKQPVPSGPAGGGKPAAEGAR